MSSNPRTFLAGKLTQTSFRYIQASFMTLEDVFVKLPESVRFDVEISEPFASWYPGKKETRS